MAILVLLKNTKSVLRYSKFRSGNTTTHELPGGINEEVEEEKA